MNNKELLEGLCSLAVLRDVAERPPFKALRGFLEAESLTQRLSLYSELIRGLGDYSCCLSELIKISLYESENSYIRLRAAGKKIPPSLERNLEAELELLSRMSCLTAEDLWQSYDYSGYIPAFENEKTDFLTLYKQRADNVASLGYGIFALHGMLRVSEGKLVPVEVADSVSVDSFVGYEKERQTVLDNTQALCQGRAAQNILLCGDAGTGKSSTVKAVANLFFHKGVRLIELRKDQLFELPYIMGRIADNPLRFIIFIDDLSFNKNDDCFSMLKAVLEGSSLARSSNAVIYATSNRRHIIKESFADRTGTDDVHRNDTMQELLSLSDRFGITVYFQKPCKALYLEIVHELADRYGIAEDRSQLDIRAEAFALSKGSRSPRCAEQFIKSLL